MMMRSLLSWFFFAMVDCYFISQENFTITYASQTSLGNETNLLRPKRSGIFWVLPYTRKLGYNTQTKTSFQIHVWLLVVLIPTNLVFFHSNNSMAIRLMMPAFWTPGLGVQPKLMMRAFILLVRVIGATVINPNAQCLVLVSTDWVMHTYLGR